MKKLSEMSNEELWQLFPIFLTEHRKEWKDWYEEEHAYLERILPPQLVKNISHVGSTSVDTIRAKPIVDILLEVVPDCDFSQIEDMLVSHGYLCMSRSGDRFSFNKGYTENGFAEKVYHLHLRREGDHDEIFFRDYLRKHPEAARDYEKLKLTLWRRYEYDRDSYTEGKTDFVRKYTRLAREEAKGSCAAVIRPARLNDAETLLGIYGPYVRNTAISFEYKVPGAEECQKRMSKIVQKYPFLVVEEDKNIIGYAYASPFHEREAYGWSVETSIYVKQGFHGYGHGKRLYRELERILQKQHYLNMYACLAFTDQEDEYLTNASKSFHECLGFRTVGRFSRCGYKFGRWYDMIWMEKMIGVHGKLPDVVLPPQAELSNDNGGAHCM